MLERQKAEGVVVLRIDRLFRLNDELETLIDLSEQHGGRVVTVEGDIDLATPSGRLVAGCWSAWRGPRWRRRAPATS